MSAIWLGVDPRPPVARVLAMAGPSEPLLKARLLAAPKHPRALATLCEALALWQGAPVRAALAVGDDEPWCDMSRYHVGFADFGETPLYSLDVVSRLRRPRRRDAMPGMGDFRDLRQLLLFEVAR
jgi:hypothetical protein